MPDMNPYHFGKSGKSGKEMVRIFVAKSFGLRYSLTTLTCLTREYISALSFEEEAINEAMGAAN